MDRIDLQNVTIWSYMGPTRNQSFSYVGNYCDKSAFYTRDAAELYRLKMKYKNICTATISDNDTVHLMESVSFPKQIVKANKIPIKFSESATKMVDNINPYLYLYALLKVEEGYIIRIPFKDNYLFPITIYVSKKDLEYYKVTINTIIDQAATQWNHLGKPSLDECYYFGKVPFNDDLPDNIVPFYSFINYINSKLPVPSEEEKESLNGLLDSNEETNVKLGFNLLKSYNNSSFLFHLMHNIASNHYSSKITSSIAYKYICKIYYAGEITKRELRRAMRWQQTLLNKIYSILYLGNLVPDSDKTQILATIEDLTYGNNLDMVPLCSKYLNDEG